MNTIINDVTPITKDTVVLCYHAELATESKYTSEKDENSFMKDLLSTNYVPGQEMERRVWVIRDRA